MRRDDRVRLEEAPSLRLLEVHAADALSFPFGLALIVLCKERIFFPYTRAGAFCSLCVRFPRFRSCQR
ncbi:unnamed protein product [Sphagnum tenellum]